MNNELYLKKIDEAIDYALKKRGSQFNLEYLINTIISKININAANDTSTNALENILIVIRKHIIILLLIRNYFIVVLDLQLRHIAII